MNILFITSSRIGDAVISCGILEALRLKYPQARFTIACGTVAEGAVSYTHLTLPTKRVE